MRSEAYTRGLQALARGEAEPRALIEKTRNVKQAKGVMLGALRWRNAPLYLQGARHDRARGSVHERPLANLLRVLV